MSDLESFARARVGTTLREGKYRLEKLLGVGGMAAVYQAMHRVGNRVALKVLHPHMSLNADVRTRFLREGYVANLVDHRGAVHVLDDDTAEDGSVFLAMELLKGETLEALWGRRGQKLPAREVAELAHQLLDVLAAAHDKRVVHRDIKPENLFLTDEGVVKVLDFGIARLSDAAMPGGATRTGRMMGSPAFMAPEQALGLQRKIDGQTDLWSAGATMFTLLSGQYVHDAETVEMLLVRAGSQPARSIATVAPEVPAPIAVVVDRSLAFDKALRWASARAMQEALERAYVQAFGAPMPTARGSKQHAVIAPTRDDAALQSAERASAVPATVDNTQYAVPPTRYEVPQQPAVGTGSGAAMQSMPIGASTTAGIEPSAQEPIPRPPGTRRTAAFGAGLAGIAGLIGIGAVVLATRGSSPVAPKAASAQAVSAASGLVTSATATSASVSPLEPIQAAPPLPDASVSVASVAVDAGQATHGAIVHPAPPRSRLPLRQPSKETGCTLVQYVDHGNVMFKEECP